jgi:ABC-type polysaccharide/polyol phosphate export permease
MKILFKTKNYFFNIPSGLKYIYKSFSQFNLVFLLAWQDIVTKYRRSTIGPFWIIINTFILIVTLSIVFGNLFDKPLSEYLPYIALGLIFWNYINSSICESCDAFVSSEGLILQTNKPLFIYVARVLLRNIIILLHSLILIPVIFIVFKIIPSVNILLVIFSFVLVLLNLAWISIFLAIFSTRFRDFGNIVQNLMQVCFFITPIFWDKKLLNSNIGELVININPFYHFLNLLRTPFLGGIPDFYSWIYCLILLFFGFVLSLYFFGTYYKKIAYWL